jgi:cellulose synthase operon protein C
MSTSNNTMTAEQLKARLRERSAARQEKQEIYEEQGSELWSPYLQAAAVLVFYSPATIHPVSGAHVAKEEKDHMIYELICHSQTVVNANQFNATKGNTRMKDHITYFLKDEVRKEIIHRLIKENRLEEAIAANEEAITRSSNLLQQMLLDVLRGNLADWQNMDAERLNALCRIRAWIDVSDEEIKLPAREMIDRRLQMIELLGSFKQLTGRYVNGIFHEHFKGRNKELYLLRSYVEVAPPKGTMEYLERAVHSTLGSKFRRKDPLLIYGPGGVGKSTLLAKFILEHIEAEWADRFPFVYLDFDRPNLSVNEPDTLLVEAARQLAIQYADMPEFALLATTLYNKWKDEFLSLTYLTKSDKLTLKSASRTERQIYNSGKIRKEFQELFQHLAAIRNRPFLIVLDTFEEVQYKGRAFVESMYDFMKELQHQYPALRVVVAGRAPVTDLSLETVVLEDLDLLAAEGFLLQAGVPKEIAADAAMKVGGNPLTLKLAAEVIKHIGKEEFNSIKFSDKYLFFFKKDLPASQIQGMLYQRILQHIHNPLVVKLAHPGLVLRFISPELILEVLNKPCDLQLSSIDEARSLFEELSREISLVIPSGDQVLKHRPDVRKVMLQLITNEKPALTREIHQRAIKYYEGRETLIDLAEEIYHRLCIFQKGSDIDNRWKEGVQGYLMNAFEEFPDEAQAYLAGRTGIHRIDEARLAFADPVDKERILARQAADLLNAGAPARALDLIRKHKISGSAIITFLEIRALIHSGKFGEAVEIGKAAIKSPDSLQYLTQILKELNQLSDKKGDARIQESVRAWRSLLKTPFNISFSVGIKKGRNFNVSDELSEYDL